MCFDLGENSKYQSFKSLRKGRVTANGEVVLKGQWLLNPDSLTVGGASIAPSSSFLRQGLMYPISS